MNPQLFQFNTPSDSKCALCISSLRLQQIRWKGIFLPVSAWHIFIRSLTPLKKAKWDARYKPYLPHLQSAGLEFIFSPLFKWVYAPHHFPNAKLSLTFKVSFKKSCNREFPSPSPTAVTGRLCQILRFHVHRSAFQRQHCVRFPYPVNSAIIRSPLTQQDMVNAFFFHS